MESKRCRYALAYVRLNLKNARLMQREEYALANQVARKMAVLYVRIYGRLDRVLLVG